MSLIGTIEKMHVANVLVRMETYKKTGLFVVKQDSRWVEFYCHEGSLVHVGPVRSDALLGERLLHDGIITEQELQEAKSIVGSAALNETRLALTLIDLEYLSQQILQAWATRNVTSILKVVFSWKSGELYFEENVSPPVDRLRIPLSFSSLIDNLSSSTSATEVDKNSKIQQNERAASTIASSELPATKRANPTVTLFEPSQFYAEPSVPETPAYTNIPSSGAGVNTGPFHPSVVPQTPPAMPILSPQIYQSARRIASLMQPDMVLVAANVTSLPNQEVLVTPEQWRLLTQIDGKLSLLDTCTVLNMGPDEVCLLAGELIAERLVNAMPSVNVESSGVPPAFPVLPNTPFGTTDSIGPGLIGPGFATTMQTPWGSALPTSDIMPLMPGTAETLSQWGNGESGITFKQGQGWVTPSASSMQPLLPIGF